MKPLNVFTKRERWLYGPTYFTALIVGIALTHFFIFEQLTMTFVGGGGNGVVDHFAYYSPVVIDHAKVGNSTCCTAEDLTDYPIQIQYTANRFKTVANSGHVRSSSGYDIRPYSDTCSTPITAYELQYYNGTTGQVTINVKRNLSHTVDTTIYLCYGNPTKTTDASSPSTTWSNGYVSVFHLDDNGAGSLNVNDALAAHNGTATSVTLNTSGLLGSGAADYNADGDKISLGTSYIVAGLTQPGYTAWVKSSDLTDSVTGYPIYSEANSSGTVQYLRSGCCISTAGYDGIWMQDFPQDHGYFDLKFSAPAVADNDTWVLVSSYLGYSGGTSTLYQMHNSGDTTNVNFKTGGQVNNNVFNGASVEVDIGYSSQSGASWRNLIDEVHIVNNAHGVSDLRQWTFTEYNNGIDPTTFAVLGTEVAN